MVLKKCVFFTSFFPFPRFFFINLLSVAMLVYAGVLRVAGDIINGHLLIGYDRSVWLLVKAVSVKVFSRVAIASLSA